MSNGMKLEVATMFLLITALCTLWYFGWVKPADEARQEIIRCMGMTDDLSYENYEDCLQRLQR